MAYVGHQNVSSIGGLYTSAVITDAFNTKTFKGLPNYTVVAGKTKLARLEINGVLSDTTSLTAAHDSMVMMSQAAAGAGVDGVLVRLDVSGKSGGELTFAAAVEGKKISGATDTPEPGNLLFLEDATITVDSVDLKVLEFDLSATWEPEYVYDDASADFPYPTIADTIFKTFDGKLSVTLNQALALGTTLTEVTFSIMAGNLTLSGKAFEGSNKSEDDPGGTFKTSRDFVISELSISTGL